MRNSDSTWGQRGAGHHEGPPGPHRLFAIVVAGAGIGLILGPSSTDAVNRAIGASYGEVTGISQTALGPGRP